MYPAYEPSEIRGVLNEDDAGVGWGRVARTVRNVVDAEQKTSDELDRDENHCHTAEIAIGGGRVVGNPTVELCVDRIGKLEARVEPIDDGGLQAHRGWSVAWRRLALTSSLSGGSRNRNNAAQLISAVKRARIVSRIKM